MFVIKEMNYKNNGIQTLIQYHHISKMRIKNERYPISEVLSLPISGVQDTKKIVQILNDFR